MSDHTRRCPPNRRLETVRRHLTAGMGAVSKWESVPKAPPDPILGVSEAFNKDTSHLKLNLGVGAYRTEEGKPLVLNVVREAVSRVVSDPSINKEYLPIGGLAAFTSASARLAFGPTSQALAEGRVATVQALSGTGALRVAAEFLSKHYPGPKTVLLPNPTWGNHNKIFPAGGISVQNYRYYNAATRGLDFHGMLADIEAAPPGSIILLHACAHNPTGVDPTPDQWRAILHAVQARGHLPLFDSAYQGFASGDLDRDAAAVRMFAEGGQEMLLCQSYAKNMGLYAERVGALSVVCSSKEVAARVGSQIKQVIRPMYSNPPAHGAHVASTILNDPRMMAAWKDELRGMAERIMSMRQALFSAIQARGVPGNWRHILDQIGMFTYTGLTPEQVDNMTNKWHVYMTRDGRISMAGLSSARCDHLAAAIQDSVGARGTGAGAGAHV